MDFERSVPALPGRSRSRTSGREGVRRFVIAGLVTLGVCVPVVTANTGGTASAADEAVVAVVVEGAGFGHGRGMSQWGAYGWAVDYGKDWTWILDHYFGGTEQRTTAAGQRIRVRLLNYDGLGTVGVLSHGTGVNWKGYTRASMYATETSPGVFAIYGSNTIACPSSSAQSVPDGPLAQGSRGDDVRQVQSFIRDYSNASIAVDGDYGPQTRTMVTDWQRDEGLSANGAWDADDAGRARSVISAGGSSASWTLLGTETTSTGNPVEFRTAENESSSSPTNVLGVCSSKGAVTHYRGGIDVLSSSSGNRVVNDVGIDNYVRGVIPKEISASWADAGGGKGANAVRAQAVAARSYGLAQNRDYLYSGSSQRYATTCDSMSCQVYGGTATRSSARGSARLVEDRRTDDAVAKTSRVVRTWSNGSIVSTEFSASNGPRTAGGAFPAVDDAGDATSRNPNHRWTRVLDGDSIATRYGLGTLTDVRMVEPQSSVYKQFEGHWFNDVVLTGTRGTERVNSWDFRRAFGLLSPGFEVQLVRANSRDLGFAFIGDSVGNSISHWGGELRSLIEGSFDSVHVDAVDSRCTTRPSCPGTSGVEAAASVPAGTDLVVVELGYNDSPSSFATEIDAMMGALDARNVGSVVWVNMADHRRTSSGASVYATANAALLTAAAKWPNLTVLDWNAQTQHAEQTRWFWSDDVHLTSTGQARFAVWLAAQVAGTTPLDPPSGPPRTPTGDPNREPPRTDHRFRAGEKMQLPIAGREVLTLDGALTSIPSTAIAAAVNLTAVGPSGGGNLAAWPCARPQPQVSNVNYGAGEVVPNGVVVPLDGNGDLCVSTSTPTDVLVDVFGWFVDSAGSASFVPMTPQRLVDTRRGDGGRLRGGSERVIEISGLDVRTASGADARIPDDASGVVLNVTAVKPSGNGHLRVYPCGARPYASSVNYVANRTMANGAILPLGADGNVCVYTTTSTDLVVDVAGWFGPQAGTSGFTGVRPTRVIDTREDIGAATARANETIVLDVRSAALDAVGGGRTSVPAAATAVTINVTATRARGNGYVTVWPCDRERPTTSNLNVRAGRSIANNVVAPIDAQGRVCLRSVVNTELIVDVTGWLTADAFTASLPTRFVDTRRGIGPAPR